VHNDNRLRYSNPNDGLAGIVGVMDPRIDELDIKLLDLLQADARMPYVQLASRLGVSDTTVRSRIDRLVSQLGVKFGVDVDPADLGLLYLYMAARVQGTSLARAIERVSQLPEIVFLARTTGGYDLLAEVVCRGRVDLIRVLDELRAIPGLVDIDMLHVLTVEKEDWRISRFASASTEP